MDSNKRPENMERINTPQLAEAFIAEQVEAIKNRWEIRKFSSPFPAALIRR